jgi:peptidoglycan/xylan/chitin deacetylase (PgdA/CDA1 family)
MPEFYLTIDDGPNEDTLGKLEFLKDHSAKAIWFCIGKNIEEHREAALQIIRDGHVMANHTYSHPYFSLQSLEKCKEEILHCESIIEKLYAELGIERPAKLFRFPYGDCNIFQYKKLRRFLIEQGFQSGPFDTVQPGIWLYANKVGDPHWLGTYDIREWAISIPDIRRSSPEHVEKRLMKYLDTYNHAKDQIIIVHDHVETTKYFSMLIKRFLSRGISFSLPSIPPATQRR